MRLARQPLTAVAVMLVIALGIPLASDTPSLAATTITFSPSPAIAGEYTYVRGRLTTAVVRPVSLQYYSNGWKLHSRSRTFDGGYFRFRPRAVAPSRSFRVVAPRVTINGRVYSGQITSARRLYTVRQTASLRLIPAPVGQAKDATTSDLTPAALRFTPIRRGRKVALQRYSGGSWRVVATGVQNAQGLATFNTNTAYARNYSHRALAYGHNGAAFVVSTASRALVKKRIFNDDFTGTALNPDKWNYRQLGLRDKKRTCAESSKKSVSVANGSLRFRVREITPDNPDYDPLRPATLSYENGGCPDGQYYNGHIGSNNRFDTRYGIMASRIRFPVHMGQHGAFWSQPSNGGGVEIDIVEYFGRNFPVNGPIKGAGAIQHSIYSPNVSGRIGGYFDLRWVLGNDKTFDNSYHVFSVEWTPSVYIFRVDGYETFRTTRGSSDVRQYLILSLLTSNWELPRLPAASKLGPMYVDWTRVWAY